MVTEALPIAIRQLELTFFRNYAQLELVFETGIQIICGPNGTGKTNLLEAIYLQAVTKSFRTPSDSNLVQQEQRFFTDTGIWDLGSERVIISCHWMQGRGKKVFWNHVPVSRLSSHIGKIPVVISLPEDNELIREGGAERRKWLDLLLSQADTDYLQEWIRYEQFLAQRNALLKQITEGKKISASEIELWTIPLIQSGMILHQKRKNFIEEFLPVFKEQYSIISSGKEIPYMLLKSTIEQNTVSEWQQQLQRMQSAEQTLGRTLVGIHREDIEMELNQKSVRQFASQGQTKSFVLALRLAQYYYLTLKTQKKPILLLDDVFEKLDAKRINQIAVLLETIPAQLFITDTDENRMRQHFRSANFISCPI
ncbi:MAG: DNA replication and repair protein RecF [Bacteroidia bacterium]|nr:DNA replication and repair protein RecF [Bacteroidia bacterium]